MVTVTTKFSEKEFIKVNFLLFRYSIIGVFFSLWVFALFYGVFAILFLDFEIDISETPQVLITPLLAILLPSSVYFGAKKKYKQTPAHETLTYTFDQTEVHIKGETFESRVRWNLFTKIRVKKGWLMLYQNMNHANFIPLKAFTSEEDFNIFLQYAANNGFDLRGKIKY